MVGRSMEKNLEKSCVAQNQIWNIFIGNIEVNNKKHINNELYLDYKNRFNERQHVSIHDMNSLLNGIPKFSRLSKEQSLECEKWITKKELFEA